MVFYKFLMTTDPVATRENYDGHILVVEHGAHTTLEGMIARSTLWVFMTKFAKTKSK